MAAARGGCDIIMGVESRAEVLTGVRDEVVACHDLLVRILSFSPTPSDLGRCAGVNRAFRAASEMAGGILAARTQPAAAALQAKGAFALNHGGLGLRIARAFAVAPEDTIYPELQDLPFVREEYTLLLQLRDSSKGGAVCFSSSGVLTESALDDSYNGNRELDPSFAPPPPRFQRFDNEVQLAEAESDSFWKVYCAAVKEHAHEGAEFGCDRTTHRAQSQSTHPHRLPDYLRHVAEDVDRLELFLVLARRSDGAVHQLVHGLLVDVAETGQSGLDRIVSAEERSVRFLFRRYVDIGLPSDPYEFALTLQLFMVAENRKGAPWKYVDLYVENHIANCAQKQVKTFDDLVHVLERLTPWI